MDKELEEMVRELYDKQAIRDVINNYSRGVDRQDRELLLSCYHADAVDDHGMFVGGPEDFFDWTNPSHLQFFRVHQHIVTNHTCSLDGDSAHTETYWTFAGMTQPDDQLVMFGGRYIDRMEKRHGDWRIAARKCVLEWWGTPGDGMVAEESIAAYAAVGKVAKDRTDCSYDRPLEVDLSRLGIRMGV